jgi:hypothetical protein
MMGWITYWKGYEMKQSWPNSRYCSSICLRGSEEKHEKLNFQFAE